MSISRGSEADEDWLYPVPMRAIKPNK